LPTAVTSGRIIASPAGVISNAGSLLPASWQKEPAGVEARGGAADLHGASTEDVCELGNRDIAVEQREQHPKLGYRQSAPLEQLDQAVEGELGCPHRAPLGFGFAIRWQLSSNHGVRHESECWPRLGLEQWV
jgi:hypothetical protein